MWKEKTKGSEVTIFRQYRQYNIDNMGFLKGCQNKARIFLKKKKKRKKYFTFLSDLDWLISSCRDDQRLHPHHLTKLEKKNQKSKIKTINNKNQNQNPWL
jgi:hypothetical protein